jgi:hypothetical protein
MLALVACSTAYATPTIALEPQSDLCVTKGAIADRAITEPTVRAVAAAAGGDAVQLGFIYRGDAATTRALANGQLRRQVGVKLRAQNSCNVIYVMWRLDPRPELDVSVKINPGKVSHAECGAEGYTKVHPSKHASVPALAVGDAHTLRAEIVGDDLVAWIDGHLAWQGTLPVAARDLVGPAGLRTDNIGLSHLELSAPKGKGGACKRGAGTEE